MEVSERGSALGCRAATWRPPERRPDPQPATRRQRPRGEGRGGGDGTPGTPRRATGGAGRAEMGLARSLAPGRCRAAFRRRTARSGSRGTTGPASGGWRPRRQERDSAGPARPAPALTPRAGSSAATEARPIACQRSGDVRTSVMLYKGRVP